MAGKKAFGFVRDCVEKYIPSIALAALFIIFCYQVFMRYVLRQPQAWAGEVEQSCFLWLVLLGACYAQRMKAHVTFTLLYDKLSIKGKAVVPLRSGSGGAPSGDHHSQMAQNDRVFPVRRHDRDPHAVCARGDI